MDDIVGRLQKTYRAFADAEEIRSVMNDAGKEIATMRVALDGVRRDLAPIHMCDVVSRDCAICKAVLRIDAALTCHP